MADVGDVEQALVDAVIAATYPNGVNSVSVIGIPLRIHRGKITNTDLRFDRANGVADVGVGLTSGGGRNTTRWGVQVTELPTTPSLTVGTSGNSATFCGAATSGDIAGVLVADQAYLYEANAGDSAALVCAALADSIRGKMICWLTGDTLTVPGVSSIIARCSHRVNAVEEWARQESAFCVSISTQGAASRDTVGRLIAASLAQTAFLNLPDGTGGRLRYQATTDRDNEQGASVYSRDIVYDVEYATTTTSANPTMLFADLAWNGTTILA